MRYRVLLISYWYPPDVGAAAERVGSFARYLPEHGWDVHVLTAGRPVDSDEVNPVHVHAVRDPFSGGRQPFADYDPQARASIIRQRIRDHLFLDRFAGWRIAAHRRGVEILRQHRFDLILASFPPASAVKLALLLHQATGVPLVLDFRDRWFGPGGYEPRQERSRQRHKALERTAVGAATGIVTVSEPLAEALSIEFSLDADRVLPILNGFEPFESPSTVEPPIRKTHRFVVAHVGTVIGRNRPDLLFKSLLGIKADLRMREVLFRFVGNLSRAYLSRAGLGDIVQTTGLLPLDRARSEMFGADALLLLTGSYVGRWGNNAKLFEYLQTGRPILCLEEAPGTSNDRRLLERHAGDRSFFAPVHDPDEIARSMGAIRAFCSGSPVGLAVGDDALEQYSRRHLAARLSEFLSRTVESTGPAN